MGVCVGRMNRLKRLVLREPAPYRAAFLFLLGSGRSGNTLLRKLLVERYQVYIPAETYVIPEALAAFNRARHLDWPARVRLVLATFEYQTEFHTISRRGLLPVYQNCLALPCENQTFGDILNILWAYLGENASIDYVLPGDKTPLNMYSINMIARAFPNGRFLFITRNPLDVCSSYLKMKRYTSLRDAVLRWQMAHKNWLRFAGQQRDDAAMLVRYEDLVMAPAESVSEIGAWLEVPERSAELPADVFWGDINKHRHHAAVKSTVSPDSIGKGAQSLTPEEVAYVRDNVGVLARRFGYDL